MSDPKAPTPREGNGNSGNFAREDQKERSTENEAKARPGEPDRKDRPPA